MAETTKSFADVNKLGSVNGNSVSPSGAKKDDSSVVIGALAVSPTLSRMLKIGRGEAVPKNANYKLIHDINCKLLENYKTAPERLRRSILKDWTEFCVRDGISHEAFLNVANHSEAYMINALGNIFTALYSEKNKEEVSPEAEQLAKRLLIKAYVADAATNIFDDKHPVQVDWRVTEVKEGKEKELEKQKLLIDNGDYYASAAIVYEHGDEHSIYTPTDTGWFESCSFERSESGKIINPSDYQEACMTSGICRQFFSDGLVELLYKAKWEDWQFDHKNKTYTATYTDENGRHSIQFEVKHERRCEIFDKGMDTHKIVPITHRIGVETEIDIYGEKTVREIVEPHEIPLHPIEEGSSDSFYFYDRDELSKITQISEREGVKIISEMDFTGMTLEEFKEQVDRYQDVIDEAQELQEAQENGGPSM